MKISLLTEIAEENMLLNRLDKGVRDAKSAFIAVSFISKAGLDYLMGRLQPLLNQNRSISIYTSGYLGITEPEALASLLSLTESYPPLKANFKPKNRFHAKFLLFPKADGTYCLFVGSSNITIGGLASVGELNVQIDGKLSDQVYQDIQVVISNLKKDRSFRKINRHLIEEYEKRRRPSGKDDTGHSAEESLPSLPLPETMPVYIVESKFTSEERKRIRREHRLWRDYVDYMRPLTKLNKGDYFLNVSTLKKTFTVSKYIMHDRIGDLGRIAQIVSGKDRSLKELEKELGIGLRNFRKEPRLDIIQIAILKKKFKGVFPRE